ncbi:ParB/RepB/Spo0J family partition protein [Sinomonas sp. P47F7]|uniref:ParB/RepB/Spo0J family partition protein n=1 Tax=Sinomonas sp. P47F7 TaxID=3410987 RepID=UPI003BF47155
MTTFEVVPLAKLEPHPRNIRKDLGELAELAQSIQAKGIEQALAVAPHPTRRTAYVVLAGHRRLAAAKLAKLRMVPCMIRDDLTTEAAQTEFMLIENTHRRDLTVLEEADAVQGLFDLGLDEKTIAENIGRSRGHVRGRAKIASLGDKAKARLEDHTLTIEQAIDLAEFEGDTYATGYLLDRTAWGGYAWKHEVEQLRRKRKVQDLIPKTVAKLRKAGAELLDSRPTHEELNADGLASTGDWRGREYFKDWTLDQHVAAGHKAVVDERSDGKPVWIAPRPAEWNKDDEPQVTPEEAARREEEDRIVAGLEVAANVRDEFVRETVFSPPSTVLSWAKHLDVDELMKTLDSDNPFALAVVGVERGSVSNSAFREKLLSLSAEALSVLRQVAKFGRQETVLRGKAHFGSRVDGWGVGRYGDDYAAKWRETLTGVLGYVFSDIEKEAMQHVASVREAEAAQRAADRAEDGDRGDVDDEQEGEEA